MQGPHSGGSPQAPRENARVSGTGATSSDVRAGRLTCDPAHRRRYSCVCFCSLLIHTGKREDSFFPLQARKQTHGVKSCAPGHAGRAGIGAQVQGSSGKTEVHLGPNGESSCGPTQLRPPSGSRPVPIGRRRMRPHCPEHTHLRGLFPRALYPVPCSSCCLLCC